MSFVSKAWSSETLERGLALAHSSSHSMLKDPDMEAMQQQLQELQDSHWSSLVLILMALMFLMHT